MSYYIKGASNYDTGVSAKTWMALHRAGYPSGDYTDDSWKNINTSGAVGDPYYLLGGDGGASQTEIGLSGSSRIRIVSGAIDGWSTSSGAWISLFESGAAIPVHNALDGLNDGDAYEHITQAKKDDYDAISGDYLTTSGTVSDYKEISGSYITHKDSSISHHDPSGYETISGDWETWGYDITGLSGNTWSVFYSDGSNLVTELALGTSGHVLSSNGPAAAPVFAAAAAGGASDHNDLNGLNDGDNYEHITQTQKDALHTIYTLESHDNDYHSEDFAIESGLHTQNHDNTDHTTNYEAANANIQSHVGSPPTDSHHAATVASNLNHDDIANPQGNAEEQHMTSAQISVLHAAVTVNAPIVLTAQDIELKNSVGTRVTAISTAAISSSNTLVPTSNAVNTFVGITHSNISDAHHAVYADADAVQAVEDAGLVLTEDSTISFNADPADTGFAGLAMDIDTTGCNLYDAVYIDGVNSVAPIDADSFGTMPCIGIVVAVGKVLTHGVVKDDDLIVCTTDGAVVYASLILRKLTETVPPSVGDIVQVVGICVGDHTLYVNPSLDWVVRQ